jgi:hypothetical protein
VGQNHDHVGDCDTARGVTRYNGQERKEAAREGLQWAVGRNVQRSSVSDLWHSKLPCKDSPWVVGGALPRSPTHPLSPGRILILIPVMSTEQNNTIGNGAFPMLIFQRYNAL